MDKIWWLLVITTIILVFVIIKIKSELDKLKETVRLNKELSEKDASISSKELSILDTKIELTNKSIESCDTRLDNAAVTIKNIAQQIEHAEKQLEELRNQLAIFTEIDADSKQLNANDDEKNSEIELDAEQKAAFDLMSNGKTNMFITGKAGTGKSFLLKYFVQAMQEDFSIDKKVLVMAPTGIAALNAEGVTIHSAFGFKNLVYLNIEDITEDSLILKPEQKLVLRKVNTIIIDEISMVRADTFEKLDIILKILNDNSKPFGDKQIILFGDLFQLPPIADKEESKYLKDTFGNKYFFCSNAYKNAEFTFCELTINHRQKDDMSFFEVLNNIRENNITDDDLNKLNSRTKFEKEELRRVVQLFPHKGKVDNINQSELNKIPAKEYVFKCRITYNKNDLTLDIEKMMPFSETLKLKLGALVMMISNDENRRWVNGTLAIVSHISENCIKVKIDGFEYEILPRVFKQFESIYKDGKIFYNPIFIVEQYPIVLAYAITIHKSQGMTYKKVACDVSNCFETGQVYVALSRCSSLNGLYLLEPVNRKMLGVESEILEFYKKEKQWSNYADKQN